jgi:hypothetical protein
VEGQLLRADLDEFTPTVGHPPAETFPRTRDSELAMVQIVVELIPEFPQNGPDPRLGLVACDGGEVEFLGELWVEPEKGDGADDDSQTPFKLVAGTCTDGRALRRGDQLGSQSGHRGRRPLARQWWGGNSRPQVGRGRMEMEEEREVGALSQNGVKLIGFGPANVLD